MRLDPCDSVHRCVCSCAEIKTSLDMFFCPLQLSHPPISELLATVALEFVFLEKSILDRFALAREVIARSTVECKDFSNLTQSVCGPRICSQFRSFLSCHLGNHSAFFFPPTLNSAGMKFRQHWDVIAEDLFVQGCG